MPKAHLQCVFGTNASFMRRRGSGADHAQPANTSPSPSVYNSAGPIFRFVVSLIVDSWIKLSALRSCTPTAKYCEPLRAVLWANCLVLCFTNCIIMCPQYHSLAVSAVSLSRKQRTIHLLYNIKNLISGHLPTPCYVASVDIPTASMTFDNKPFPETANRPTSHRTNCSCRS